MESGRDHDDDGVRANGRRGRDGGTSADGVTAGPRKASCRRQRDGDTRDGVQPQARSFRLEIGVVRAAACVLGHDP